jgi:alpha-glucosidase
MLAASLACGVRGQTLFQDSKGDGYGDLKGIVQRLDYLQGLGVDGILLSPFQLQGEFGRTKGAAPFDPKYGSEEDLDQLVQEASRRKIRIFVDLPLSTGRSPQQTVNEARFWLSRGIAGLRLVPDAADMQERRAAGPFAHEPWLSAAQVQDRVRQLTALCASFAGQRVLVSDLPEMPAPVATGTRRGSRTAAIHVAAAATQMAMDNRLALMPKFDADDLRKAMAAKVGNMATPVTLTDSNERPRSVDRYGDGPQQIAVAKVMAAALLGGGGAPLVYFGQEIGMATTPAPVSLDNGPGDPTPMQWGGDQGFTIGVPWMDMGRNAPTANVALEDADADSLLNWYRRLSALRHANAALRSGTMQPIAETNPDIVAWLRVPAAGGTNTPPVVVVCNMTARPLLVSVAGDLRRIGLQTGNGMMHTLASTSLASTSADPVTGPVSLSAISLPAYGVYIGELGRQAGLESSPAPAKRSSRTPSKASR